MLNVCCPHEICYPFIPYATLCETRAYYWLLLLGSQPLPNTPSFPPHAHCQAMRQTQSLRDLISRLESELSSCKKSLDSSQAVVADLVKNASNKEMALVKVKRQDAVMQDPACPESLSASTIHDDR